MRTSYVTRGVVHQGLAYSAIRLAAGQASSSGGSGQKGREATATALSVPGGEWLVWGIATRGVVFIAIAWLMTRAASSRDPGRTGGIGDALRALEGLGRWPFAAIAVGLVAYGGYQLLNARYRRIRAR